MELAVLSHRGIPETGVISIRSGHTRRQVQLGALDGRPLQFPCEPGQSTTFKVDVFEEIGRTRFAFDPAVRKYCLPLDAAPHGGGVSSGMEITFSVHAAGDAEGRPPHPDGGGDDQCHPAGEEGGREAAARGYLEDHGIMAFMQFLMQGLMREKPPDPYTFLQRQVTTRMVSELMREAAGGDAAAAELLDEAEFQTHLMTPEQRRRLSDSAAKSSEQMRADNERLRDTAEQLKAKYATLLDQNSALCMLPEPPLQPPMPPPQITGRVHGGDDEDAGGSGGEEWEDGADAKAAAPCDAVPLAAQAEPPLPSEPQVPAEHRGRTGDEEEEEEIEAKAAAPCEPPAPPAAQAEPPPPLEPRAPVECKGRAGDDYEREDEEEADAKAAAPVGAAVTALQLGPSDEGQRGGPGPPVEPPQPREGGDEAAAEVDIGPLPPPSENEPPELAAKRDVLRLQSEIRAFEKENTELVSELSRIKGKIDTLQSEIADHHRNAPLTAVA